MVFGLILVQPGFLSERFDLCIKIILFILIMLEVAFSITRIRQRKRSANRTDG